MFATKKSFSRIKRKQMSYYYIQYSITSQALKKHESNCVSNKHPLDWLKFYHIFSSKWDLIDWKEITEEEYEKGKDIIGIG